MSLAIGSDPNKNHNVFIAEKIHKQLKKSLVADPVAKEFFEKGKALYSYSSYFEGASKDLK